MQVIYYETPDNENTVVKFTAGGKAITSHPKTDSFGRKVFDELQLGTGFVSRSFDYLAGEITEEHMEGDKLKSTPTTQLISRITMSDGRTIDYEYDEEERITKVIDSIDGTTVYTYDALGQLLTETVNGSAVNTMTYDSYGNIRTKNGTDYTYGDSVWKDKLTKVGTKTITYDEQGNPTTYLGNTLTWEKGRQLKQLTKSDGTAVSYTYNANGIRTSKTINGTTHTYTLDGTKILSEVWGSNTLIPLYDNEDEVCGIIYNNTPYYFYKNQQGDIIEITERNAAVVARYTYDAWGKVTAVKDANGTTITSTTHIANINPYRYRGYYYDVETKLYYLQSRYYDPEVGRFVNGDDIMVFSKIRGTNLFSYCCNNPVSDYDLMGKVGLSILFEVLQLTLDMMVAIAQMTGAVSKEMEKLNKKIKNGKNRGASQDFFDELKKKKKELTDPKKLGVGKIKRISTVMGYLAMVISLIPILKGVKNGIKTVAEFVADVLNECLVFLVEEVGSSLCKLVPGLGFLLGLAVSYILGKVASKLLNSKKAKNAKKRFVKKANKSSSLKTWITLYLRSLKECF